MKIRFIVLNAYAQGGTARTTLDTASRLAAHHDVEVVSVNQHRGTAAYPIDPRVRVRSLVDKQAVADPGATAWPVRALARTPSALDLLSGGRDPRLSLLSDIRLTREIRSMRQGLLIGTRPNINCAIARFARPGVYTLGQEHQYLQKWSTAQRRAIGRLYPRLDAVTGLTRIDAASYRRLLPPEVLVTDLPNAMPVVGSARSDLSSTVVASTGRLAHQKGYDLLIEAFRTVAERHPDWSLHIYGTGPARQQLSGQIEASQLTGRVLLKGFSATLPQDLAAASIFALSSRFEGFSLALVEAMGVGLPPVAFACPQGPPEIITDGEDGLLVPAEDTAALAEGICSLIENPLQRCAIGTAARRAVERYSAAVVDGRWERLILDLTALPPGIRRVRHRSG